MSIFKRLNDTLNTNIYPNLNKEVDALKVRAAIKEVFEQFGLSWMWDNDGYALAYPSVVAANAAIPSNKRYNGMIVYIAGSTPTEPDVYCYLNGTADINLIKVNAFGPATITKDGYLTKEDYSKFLGRILCSPTDNGVLCTIPADTTLQAIICPNPDSNTNISIGTTIIANELFSEWNPFENKEYVYFRYFLVETVLYIDGLTTPENLILFIK